MITVEQIQEIISLYHKYGWKLRQVLLTDKLRRQITDFQFEAEVVESEIDAVWFSRPSGEKEAWELRRLSVTPYALFETFDEEDEEEVREEIRREMEARLKWTFYSFQNSDSIINKSLRLKLLNFEKNDD